MRMRQGLPKVCWEIRLISGMTNPNSDLNSRWEWGSLLLQDMRLQPPYDHQESREKQREGETWVLGSYHRAPELTTPEAALPLDLSLLQGTLYFLAVLVILSWVCCYFHVCYYFQLLL